MPATIQDRVAELREEAQATVDTALAENRVPTPDEQMAIDSRLAAMSILGNLGTTSDDVAAMFNSIAAPAQRDRRPRDFGSAFVESPQWQNFREQNDGEFSSRVKMNSKVNVGRIKNALLVDPEFDAARTFMDVPTGVAYMDLMNAITVIDDAPKLVNHVTGTFTNAAAAVAEGVAKPEATLAFTTIALVQEVIAQHLPVTNQALSHNAVLRQLINAFLVNGVRAVVQTTVAADLAAWSGLGTQAFSTDIRTTLRKAITKAQNAGAITGAGAPSILISATDAETLDLEQLTNLVLSPGEAPRQATNIWRAPLVVVANVPAGFAYVGDLKQVVWYTTGDVTVSVGWVGNQFIENEQTILAETEGVTGVFNAAAIIKADLTAV